MTERMSELPGKNEEKVNKGEREEGKRKRHKKEKERADLWDEQRAQ